MIYGMTNEQKNERYQEYLKDLYYNGTKHFAFLPKRMADGRWVWLQTYYKHYRITKSDFGFSWSDTRYSTTRNFLVPCKR